MMVLLTQMWLSVAMLPNYSYMEDNWQCPFGPANHRRELFHSHKFGHWKHSPIRDETPYQDQCSLYNVTKKHYSIHNSISIYHTNFTMCINIYIYIFILKLSILRMEGDG